VRRSALPALATALLALSACTSFSGSEDQPDSGSPAAAEGAAVTASPEPLTLVTDGSPAAIAAATSRALFESSDVAVLAHEGDDAGTLLAASAAAGLGVPLLLEAPDGTEDPALAEELWSSSDEWHQRWHAFPVPTIAAVNGPAVGAGFGVALACDLIVASSAAEFGIPEVKRSLVAAAGGVFLLPRALPKAVALQMIATGEPITAARASHFGLVNEVVPAAEVLTAAFALARKVCANAPIAVRESLGIARRAADLDQDALWELSRAASQRVRETVDFQEGPRAFVEKRPPRWVGR
jgi:enoyl-CoA hydratase/carnithine racemase